MGSSQIRPFPPTFLELFFGCEGKQQTLDHCGTSLSQGQRNSAGSRAWTQDPDFRVQRTPKATTWPLCASAFQFVKLKVNCVALLRGLNDLIHIAYLKYCLIHVLLLLKPILLSCFTGSEEYTEHTRGNFDWLYGPQVK